MNTPPIEDQDLARQLHSYYQEEMGSPAPASVFWYKLSEQLPAQQAQTRWQRWFQAPIRTSFAVPTPRRAPARRLAVGLSLALGVLLLVSGVLYTTGSLRSQVGQPAPATGSTTSAAALLASLLQSDSRISALSFTQVNQAKSVNSGTVDLQKIYADANNIVLGYTFEGNFGHDISYHGGGSPHLPTITLPDQQKLQPSISEIQQKGDKVAVVSYYNGATIQQKSGPIQLKISIPTDKTTEEFTPTVNFSAGKTVQINQSVTSNGNTITLERAVITPSETRFYYTTSSGAKEALSWKVSVAGKTYQANVGYYGGKENYASIWSSEIKGLGFLTQTSGPIQPGTWTVTATAPGSPKDSWQFKFTVA